MRIMLILKIADWRVDAVWKDMAKPDSPDSKEALVYLDRLPWAIAKISARFTEIRNQKGKVGKLLTFLLTENTKIDTRFTEIGKLLTFLLAENIKTDARFTEISKLLTFLFIENTKIDA
jgi:hypothetical protein